MCMKKEIKLQAVASSKIKLVSYVKAGRSFSDRYHPGVCVVEGEEGVCLLHCDDGEASNWSRAAGD